MRRADYGRMAEVILPPMPKAPFGVALLALGMGVSPLAQSQATKPADLRIVVISGEDAVNIIQQRTAVAPVVEVRDRNNQPVAGAVVTFTLQGGSNATFAGASTVTATTNTLGQAAVTSLTPTGTGAVQINVAAAFQGQTATAAITQTNVATAAQAASSGASSGAAAGGGGSGGGIGAGTITALTVGAVGAAGGLYAYRELQKGDAPTMDGLTVFPPTGLVAIHPIQVSPNSMTWHDEGEFATLTIDFGDGTTISHPMNFDAPVAPDMDTHVYQSTGTFTVRVTLTDAWDRAASQQGSVTITSLTGRWNVGTTGSYFTLTQQGTALSGTLTSTSAESCGSLTGSVRPMVLGNNAGNVTFAVTAPCPDFNSSFTGSTVFNTPDRMVGTLTTRTGTSNVTLNRQ